MGLTEKGTVVGATVVVGLWLAAIIGWVANLLYAIGHLRNLETITTEGWVSVLGVALAPLGTVMGWIQLLS